MALFEIPPEEKPKPKKQSGLKTKKNQLVEDLLLTARKLVMEKLGKYKDTSKCITNIQDLKDFFAESDDLIGIDTETTGLNVFTDEIVGISLCNGKHAIYIPLNHKDSIFEQRLKNQVSIDEFRTLFIQEINNSKYRWIYHNAYFDLAVLRTFLGVNMPNPYWDTLICSKLIYQPGEHSLKFLYNKYIAEEDEGVNRFDTLFKGVTFDFIPLDIATIYAGKDAFMTYELYKYQYDLLNRNDMEGLKNVMETIEMPILPILVDMRRYGINMNSRMLDNLYATYSAKLENAKQKVHAELDKYKNEIDAYRIQHYDAKLDDPINLASPSQLSILFYKILHYTTKNGKGTGVNELVEINTPLTLALLEYRKMEKLIDAFLVALPKNVEQSTGKIHTMLNQYGADTGRFSSSNPNLQQIPSHEGKEIRRLFGATPGYIMMSSDFSQQEPRCLAHFSGDESLIEAYAKGKDIYAVMASQAFHMPYDQCTEFYLDENGKKTSVTNPEGKARRSKIKGILLGIMYGRGTASIAQNIHVSLDEAQEITDNFYQSYPAVKAFQEEAQRSAKEKGYTTTAWGRRRYLEHIQKQPFEYKYNNNRPIDFNPLFTIKEDIDEEVSQEIQDYYNSKLERANFTRREFIINQAKEAGVDITNNQGFVAEAMRQVVNSTIQGSAADMSKRAMILIGQNQELKDLGFHMLFPVHDEIIAECPFENRKRCAELLSSLMIQAGAEKISVPMKCDTEAFFYWYGPDVELDETDEITMKQYNDYINTGIYKERDQYVTT